VTFHHTALKLLPLASCSWIAAVDISTLPFEEQKRLKDDWNELKLRLIEVYTRCDVHHACVLLLVTCTFVKQLECCFSKQMTTAADCNADAANAASAT